MKSRIWYACVIAMLVVSTVGFGEIMYDGDWDGYTSGGGSVMGDSGASDASAYADGDDCYSYGYGVGWQWIYTTENAWCDYSYYAYTWAEAHLFLWDGELSFAYGQASANGRSPFENTDSTVPTATASVLDYGYDGDWKYDDDGPYSDYVCVTYGKYFTSNTGISCTHSACALAEVGEGGDNQAFGYACARAWGDLSEH